jgi:hypothetical protein
MHDLFAGQDFTSLAVSGKTDGSPKTFREQVMPSGETLIPELDNDPVLRLLWRGEARTVHEAEEQYLNASMPAILELLASDLSDSELCSHPLLVLLRVHGSRGREDSLL